MGSLSIRRAFVLKHLSSRSASKRVRWGQRAFGHDAAVAVADVGRRLSSASRVLVMSGAGLSTPSGIPDFRTPGSGVYDNLRQFDLPYPEAIFDIDYYRAKPAAFNAWARQFFPGVNYQVKYSEQ